MTVGSWNPDSEKAKSTVTLNSELLQRFLTLSRSDLLDDLEQQLDTREQEVYAQLMRCDKEQWFEALTAFSDEDIEHLMKFFTKAERLPGWQAGADSPAIWLGKVLKKRGVGISKALTLWIKANSDNRYLPHGPLL